MITYVCMTIILIFLAFIVLYKAEIKEVNDEFFGVLNTTAMRGFWCLVIILVHISPDYQNRIQDMISSFGYIGVTFFFMTSGYVLKLGVMKKPQAMQGFWTKRLPKLLIPYIIVMAVYFFITICNRETISWYVLYSVGGWVLWLLFCYLIFWLVYSLNLFGAYKDIAISILLTLFSMVIFFLGDFLSFTTWTTEIYGFIWGIILAGNKDKFLQFATRKWQIKSCILCLTAALFGVLYLKLKPVYFFGNYVVKIVLGFLILLLILELTSRISIGNRVILYIGRISYEVFLCHGIAIKLLEIFLPWVESGVFIALVIILTIIIATIIHVVADICMNRKLIFKEIKNGREEA